MAKVVGPPGPPGGSRLTVDKVVGPPGPPGGSELTVAKVVGPPGPPGGSAEFATKVVGPPGPPGGSAELAAAAVVSLIVAKAPDAALLELESSFCGTNPQALPSSLLASALITFASSLEEGSLRTRIEQEAGTILRNAFGITASKAATAGG
jgi:hypothetical protein